MYTRSLFFLATAVATLAASHVAIADWPHDPGSAVVITNAPGDQVQPKVKVLRDGGYYVSWFDGGAGGYDVRLQRFDAKGNALWQSGGILVADRDFSYTTDYGLDTDAYGDAVLAYRMHDASGIAQVAVTKIRPNGSPLWKQSVIVSDATVDTLTPYVAATGDGGTVVGWMDQSTGNLDMQKLNAKGAAVWGAGRVLTPPSGAFFLPADLKASGNDVIYSFQAQGRSIGGNQFWAQKFDADGQPLWSTDYVKLWDNVSTGVMQSGEFPKIVDDGAGGAVFCWYYVYALSAQVQAQHILADGSEVYAHNGVALSTDTTNSRSNPNCSYDEASGDIYAVWEEVGATPGTYGVYAQRLDAGGNLLWGAQGETLIPVATNGGFSSLIALPRRNGFVAAWTVDSNSLEAEPQQAVALNNTGQPVWPAGIVTYHNSDSWIGRVVGTVGRGGADVFVWENNPAQVDNEADLMMQKIGVQGSVGGRQNEQP